MNKEFAREYINFPQTIELYLAKLEGLQANSFAGKRNSQNRSVKQIIGHMIDSASNNIHRIIHLQYREVPLEFPNYATNGNNDRWIAIQNFQDEEKNTLLQLWKYIHLHILHVISNVNEDKLEFEWISGPSVRITLKDMILDFPRHFKLHLQEIDQLTDQ